MAKNWDDFVDAIGLINAPSLNILYADTAGNIGYYMSGKIPIRAKGQGLVPSPGWSGKYEWEGAIPFEQMPHSFNPEAGYIVSANNRIVGDEYPYYLGSSWRNGYRAARIEQMIQSRKLISIEFCQEMQMDFLSIPGAQLARLAGESNIEDGPAEKIGQILTEWDGILNAESTGGLVYEVFLALLSRRILATLIETDLLEQFLGAGPHPILVPVNEMAGHWTSTLMGLLEEPNALQELTGSTRDELFAEILAETGEEISSLLGEDQSQWQWGRLHQLSFDHLFSIQPAFGRSLSHGPYPIGGDSDTVFQNAYVPGDSFDTNSVSPSQRHLIDLGDLSQSKAILVPGQSGHLGSEHYGDLILPWLQGDYFNMSGSISTDDHEQKNRLRLKPDMQKAAG